MNSEQAKPGSDTDLESKESSTCQQTRSAGRINRRHVILAVMLIICGTAGWFQYVRYRDYLPVENKRAFAVVRIEEPQVRTYYPTITKEMDSTERHGRSIKGHFVLALALRQPGIAESKLLQQQRYPIEWLIDHIDVDYPDEDQLRISLRAPRTEASVAIVNAIIDSYRESLFEASPSGLQRKKLAESLRPLEDKLHDKEIALSRLDEELKAADPQVRLLEQQRSLESFGLLRKHHAEVNFELLRTRLELESREEPAASVVSKAKLRRKTELLDKQEQRLRNELAVQETQIKKSGVEAFELESLEQDVAQLKEKIENLKEEIQRLDVELATKPRVTIVRRAKL